MKITKIKTYPTEPRYLFVKIETDEGVVGYGECITVGGRGKTIISAIEEMEGLLVGQSPLEIERLYQLLYRVTFFRGGAVFMAAISGIEQALWDIKGKYYHVPVYELLGGKVRSRIRMYCHCNATNEKELDERIAFIQENGFTATKFVADPPQNLLGDNAYIRAQVKIMETLRKRLGDDFDIAADFHGRLCPALSSTLIDALAPYKPMFVEEPCLPENMQALAEVSHKTTVPIASGERLATIYSFTELLQKQAVSIVQPDLAHAGGIWETRKIAAIAEAHYVSVAPHNPIGPVALASNLQLDASMPNFLIQEYCGLANLSDSGVGFFHTPFVCKDGYIEVPETEGLGFEMDESVFERSSHVGTRRLPTVTRADGSMGDW